MADIGYLEDVQVVKVISTGRVLKIDHIAQTRTWYANETDYGTDTSDDSPITDEEHGVTKDIKRTSSSA